MKQIKDFARPYSRPPGSSGSNGWKQKIREAAQGTATCPQLCCHSPQSLDGANIFWPNIFAFCIIFCSKLSIFQMEGVKDERMKALWRPFCAGEVRRDKPGGHHHHCCQRCSCFLSCRASALSPASPSPRARQARARAEEAKILLSARTARGAGDGPRSADRSMGPGFHYVNWLLGQQRGRGGAAKLYD